MENSPLELYETAYRLHYVENRIPEAVNLYEAIIKEFPDSNECGYSVIQIQKIKANDLVKALQKRRPKLHPVAIIALIVSLVALTVAGATGIFSYLRLRSEHTRSQLAVQALGKMYRGEDDEALKLLTQLKYLGTDDITPFELSADIHRKHSRFSEARAEYDMFFRLNPARTPSAGEISTMKRDEDSMAGKALTKPAEDSVPVDSSQTAVAARTRTVTPPPVTFPKAKSSRKRRVSQPAPATRPGGNPLIVDPDSISYF